MPREKLVQNPKHMKAQEENDHIYWSMLKYKNIAQENKHKVNEIQWYIAMLNLQKKNISTKNTPHASSPSIEELNQDTWEE